MACCKLCLGILALTLLGGCLTNDEGAYQTLKEAGYTQIEVGGFDWSPAACFPWGTKNQSATKFKALSPAGDLTEGTICCWRITGGGCTIDD